MALTETKCPNCGANIVADTYKKKISCMYCHTEFTLTPSSAASADGRTATAETDTLDRAEVFLTALHKPDEALRLYSDYSMKVPGDYRGWLGIARALSDDFKKTECDSATFAKIEDNVLSAIRVAGTDAPGIQKTWEDYKRELKVIKGRNEKNTKTTLGPPQAPVFISSSEINNLSKRSVQLETEIAKTEAILQKKRSAYKPPSDKTKKTWKLLCICYGLGLIFILADIKKRKNIAKLEKKVAQLRTEKEQIDRRYNDLLARKTN